MATKRKAKCRMSQIAPQWLVDDVISTAEYYRDVLGFTFNNFFGNPPAFVIVSRDGVQLNFRQTKDRGNTSGTRLVADTYDAYVRVSNVESLAEDLRAKNANIVHEPVTRIYNMRELVVRDCNGYVLCFGEDVEPAA